MQKEDKKTRMNCDSLKRGREPRMEFVFTNLPGERAAIEVTFTNEELGDDQRGLNVRLKSMARSKYSIRV